MTLSHNDEVFTLEFAALDFASPNRNQYAYMMEGFDRDWNTVDNRHSATYRKLPAGRYVFRVRGSNNSGVWNNEGASLIVIITRPFWETLWFRSLVVLLVVSSFVMASRLRARRMRVRTRELERRVEERTAQLQAANDELEAFAYSVSHDLRAPLRAIDGFSQILADDYHHILDVDGRKVISVVRKEVKRMAKLIDDLLTLSRLGRSAMHQSEIDMTALASRVYNEITTPEQREGITFTLAHLPPALGDIALVRQVWENLLSNAIKFSSKKPLPSISINGEVANGEAIYAVSDNGAGFPNEYMNKLFGVFQRLHRAEEFEGTGVGLAIVQRLIHRHGGRVWADGAVDKGATFYFTLPLVR